MSDFGAKVDLTEFNKAFAKYVQLTSKSMPDAVNNTCFDIARFAYRGTDQADRSEIREALNAISNKYPDRTIAEMIVIVHDQSKGQEVKNLEDEADKLIRTRQGHAGYTRSGWIQALKDIAPAIGKTSFNVARPSTVLGEGGGIPVKKSSGVMIGSVFNDVEGIRNASKVEDT